MKLRLNVSIQKLLTIIIGKSMSMMFIHLGIHLFIPHQRGKIHMILIRKKSKCNQHIFVHSSYSVFIPKN